MLSCARVELLVLKFGGPLLRSWGRSVEFDRPCHSDGELVQDGSVEQAEALRHLNANADCSCQSHGCQG